jgi:O-antigen/teichoic acid export membrane protein
MPDRFIRNSLFSTLAGVSAALGGFLCMVIVARVLGVEGTGIVSYVLWIVLLSATVADFGLYATLTRYLPELTARGDLAEAEWLTWRLLRLAAAMAICVSAVFAGIAISMAMGSRRTAGDWQSDPLIWLLIALLVLIQAVANFTVGYLRGMQHFDRVARLAVGAFLLQLACVGLGAVVFGYRGAIAGYLAGSVLQAAAILSVLRGAKGTSAPDTLRRVRRFSLFAWIGAMASTVVWTRLELLFLEAFFGPGAVGLYAAALTFANLAAQGPILLTGAMLPFFSEGFGRGAGAENRSRTEKVLGSGTRIIAFFAFPACFGLAALAPLLLPMIYGASFNGAITATMIVVAASGVAAAGAVGSHLIYGHDRSDVIFYVNLGGAALSVVAGLTVLPIFGIEGAAWSRALIHSLLVLAGFWFIVSGLGFSLPFGGLLRLFAAAACAAFAAHGVLASIGGAWGLLPAVVAAAVVYALAVRALRGLDRQDVGYLSKILEKAPARLAAWLGRGLTWVAGGAER